MHRMACTERSKRSGGRCFLRAGRRATTSFNAEKGTVMFCNTCNNSTIWIILLIIILFGWGGFGCGCGCGNESNGCGCGCGCN